VLQSISVSAVVQVVLSPLTISWLYPHREELDDFPERVALWLTLAVLVVPIVGGLIAGAVTNRVPLVAGAPPTIWDWLFTTGRRTSDWS
jgi:uncharacterized membrane protein